MSHAKYTTKAFILDTYDLREADRSYLIMTRDFGTIFAEAKSSREGYSKLRYSLQKLSIIESVLVRGKTGWKMTNAKEICAMAGDFLGLGAEKEVLANIISLVRRLVRGEKKNEYLFDIIVETANSLRQKSQDYGLIETLAVLRIMDSLGYIKTPSVLSPFLGATVYDDKTLLQVKPHKEKAILEINQALEESHL